jgi:hypothetical protein
MSKIKIKNAGARSLFSFLKETNIPFKTKKVRDDVEIVSLSINSSDMLQRARNILRGYGTELYHDTSFVVDGKVENIFNYYSNQYENIVSDVSEHDLPNYYIENVNEQNEIHQNLKALNTKIISKEYIKNIANNQQALSAKISEEQNIFRNIYLGNSFSLGRPKSRIDDFCYYNKITFKGHKNNTFINSILQKLDIHEEVFEDILSTDSSLSVPFLINGATQETLVETYDLNINSGNLKMTFNGGNKLMLSNLKRNSNYMTNNFNKFLLNEYISKNNKKLLKSFTEMYENSECEKEYLIYRVDKFLDTDTSPIQTFWMYDGDFKQYVDYQIKIDSKYRYVVSCYCITYGVSTTVNNISETATGLDFIFVKRPSSKIVLLKFYEKTLKVSPNIPPAPFVKFLNESNSENSIKIYLSLKNTSFRKEPVAITNNDSLLFEDIVLDADGKALYEYFVEDGKFEVFRSTKKPTSLTDFENSKILDVRNKNSSTSAVFKTPVLPNTKYYYMFRALNVIGVPSNPTPIYEIELIKDASKSKIISKVISLDNEKAYHDKVFKSLLQIKPAFDQEIFNDEALNTLEMETYSKNINNISLGTATDKVWGKKFKIRLKSKDSGKIIDLNVKFNIVKDNIK